MKDQQRLVRKCLDNDIPVFVICGTDLNAVAALESYYLLAAGNGCSREFLNDLRLLIDDFRQYRDQELTAVKLPS